MDTISPKLLYVVAPSPHQISALRLLLVISSYGYHFSQTSVCGWTISPNFSPKATSTHELKCYEEVPDACFPPPGTVLLLYRGIPPFVMVIINTEVPCCEGISACIVTKALFPYYSQTLSLKSRLRTRMLAVFDVRCSFSPMSSLDVLIA